MELYFQMHTILDLTYICQNTKKENLEEANEDKEIILKHKHVGEIPKDAHMLPVGKQLIAYLYVNKNISVLYPCKLCKARIYLLDKITFYSFIDFICNKTP